MIFIGICYRSVSVVILHYIYHKYLHNLDKIEIIFKHLLYLQYLKKYKSKCCSNVIRICF